MSEIVVFAPDDGQRLGKQVAGYLDVSLGEHNERNFEDGEHKYRPLINVRNKDVYIIGSLYSNHNQSVNDKLCHLLFFIGAVRDAGAGNITAVVPYLCYSRKDRKTKSRDPVTTRYIATLFEAVGTNRIVTLDVHNLQAFQNAFRIQTEHLSAKKLFSKHVEDLFQDENFVVMSPDAGGIKRAEAFRQSLEHLLNKKIPSAFMEKQRSMDIVSGETVIGNVDSKNVVIIDDMIGSGTTIAKAAKACKERGAKKIIALATHGLFTGDANKKLTTNAVDRLVITNSVAPFRLDNNLLREKISVLNIAPLLGEAIKRIHHGGSLVELLETNPLENKEKALI